MAGKFCHRVFVHKGTFGKCTAVGHFEPNSLASQVAAFCGNGHCQTLFRNLGSDQQEIQNETDNCRRRGEQEVHGPIRVSISDAMRPRQSSGAFLFLS